jgi:hypothetical protein
MLSFGQAYPGSDKFDFHVSDDKRAFTLTFADFQLNLEGGKSAKPVATRVGTIVVPVGGDQKQAQIAFGMSAFAVTTEGSTGTVVLSVNGRTTVADFTGEKQESIVQEIEFEGDRPAECRICIFLLAGLDSRDPGATSLSVSTIDGEFLPRPT